MAIAALWLMLGCSCTDAWLLFLLLHITTSFLVSAGQWSSVTTAQVSTVELRVCVGDTKIKLALSFLLLSKLGSTKQPLTCNDSLAAPGRKSDSILALAQHRVAEFCYEMRHKSLSPLIPCWMQLSILQQGRGGQGDVRLAQGGHLFRVLCSVPGGS